MNKELFDNLVQSLKEAGMVARGEALPSRVFSYEISEVRKIREQTGLSQDDFAKKLNIGKKTLQGWEVGMHKPKGTAKVLIELIKKNPELVQTF